MQVKLTKQQKIKKWALIGAVLLFLCILPFCLPKAYFVHVAIMCLFWAYMSTAWNMLCGFAGTIQAYVPFGLLDSYRQGMEHVFGKGSCYVLSFRQAGGTKVLTRE